MEGREGLAEVRVNPYVVEGKMKKDTVHQEKTWYFEGKEHRKWLVIAVYKYSEAWKSEHQM